MGLALGVSRSVAKTAFLALLAALIYGALDWLVDLPPAALAFVSEEVRAIPSGAQVTFECDFQIAARHLRRRSYEIAFPIVTRGVAPLAEDVNVRVEGASVPVTQTPQGFLFDAPVTPGCEFEMSVRYRLPAPDHKAVYVSTTARLWPEPPRVARFVLPQDATSNYHSSGETVVEFHDFRPREDWRIKWQSD